MANRHTAASADGKEIACSIRDAKGNCVTEIVWNTAAYQKNISMQPRDNRETAKIVYMSPEEFLSKVPTPAGKAQGSTEPTLTADQEKLENFNETSLKYISEKIANREVIDVLYLDYGRMWYGFPSHEGRHRAKIAQQMGLKQVPVFVITPKEYQV